MTPKGHSSVQNRDLRYVGVAMMATVAAFALVGVGLGALLGSTTIGGFVGALVGVPVAMVVVWKLYVRPFRDELNSRDYSHLSSGFGDDDD